MTKLIQAFLFTLLASFTVPAMAQDATPALPQPIDVRIGHWDAIVYGDENAKITVVEHASLTCPACGTFARDVYPLLKAKYIDTGKVQFHIQNFARDEFDLTLATIARCQDNEFAKNFTKDVLDKQEEWMKKGANPAEIIMGIAAKHGVDKDEFTLCLNNPPLANHIIKVTGETANNGYFEGTPSVYVNGAYIGRAVWQNLDDAISKALLAQ